MRILVLANAMNTLSGGDKRFIEIFKRFKDRGHSVKVMLPKIGYKICKDENLNVTYQILPISLAIVRAHLMLSNLLRSVIASLVIIKNLKKYDVVYSTSDFLNDTIPAMLLRLIDKKMKWVAVTHYLIPEPSTREGNFLTNLIAFFTQRISVKIMGMLADLIITSTMFLKSQLTDLGVPKNKIEVGSNGINTKLIDDIPEKAKYYDACFVARFRPSKGIYDVIDIWEIVCKKKKNAKLIMIGDGEKAIINELNYRIKQKELSENVKIIGFRKSFDVYHIMKQSKIFLYPDTENGWGIATAEAMCSKCAVIAYDLPVYREVFGGGVIYVPLKNTSRFAEVVLNLLYNGELTKEQGERSRAVVDKYDWDKIALVEMINICDILPREAEKRKYNPAGCPLPNKHDFSPPEELRKEQPKNLRQTRPIRK